MKVKPLLLYAILIVLGQLIEVKLAESAESTEQDRARIENLEQRLRQLEAQRGVAATVTEQLAGTWACSSGPQSSKLTFLAGGQVLFEEPTLKSIERATWVRVGSEKIIISGSIRYEISFTSKNEFEFTELNTRSTGTCQKLP